jgi:hypothetical protein
MRMSRPKPTTNPTSMSTMPASISMMISASMPMMMPASKPTAMPS